MPLVASVDYPNNRVYLSIETVDADLDMLDIYREVRALRRTVEAHQKFSPMMDAGGNIEKITGLTYTPAYVRLLNGCRIVPYNTSHKIRLIRDTFTDDGFAGRDCFDRVSLSAGVDVDIDVDFPEIETRIVSTGSGLSPSEQLALTRILSLLEADEEFTPTMARKFLKGTVTELLVKNVTGGSLTGTITITE